MTSARFTAIALDLGTTSIKAGLLDEHGALNRIISLPAPAIVAHDGRYESDALLYATTAELVLAQCFAQSPAPIPLGLCSQRSSFLIWEKTSGQPLTPLISWQDNRGATACEILRTSENIIRDLTGLRLTPYYFAPKLRVVLDEHPEWRSPLERGELLVGTLDTFLIWRWSGGTHHVTDASMAARTLLMDIEQQQWSPALCQLFDIPRNILPQIMPSAQMNLPMNNGLTLQASVGDQSAALIASVREDTADALVNLGTGGFVMRYLPEKTKPHFINLNTRGNLNTPGNFHTPDNLHTPGYLRTLIYLDINQHAHIAIEGTLNSIAAALAPYPVHQCRVHDMGVSDRGKENIFCLAEPSGIGAPYFRSNLGLHFSESVAHLTQQEIATLLLEAIIFRVTQILADFHRASPLQHVYFSGGLSELACLRQGLAQCVPFDVYRLPQKESSLQGAALLAAGMATQHNRQQEKIERIPALLNLPAKYHRWNDWFDSQLNN